MNYIIANHIHKNFQYDSYHIHLTNTIFTHIDTDGGVTFATLWQIKIGAVRKRTSHQNVAYGYTFESILSFYPPHDSTDKAMQVLITSPVMMIRKVWHLTKEMTLQCEGISKLGLHSAHLTHSFKTCFTCVLCVRTYNGHDRRKMSRKRYSLRSL